MLFQMLTGVLPFRGESMAELMYKIANEEAPDLRSVRSELPQNLTQAQRDCFGAHTYLRRDDVARGPVHSEW